MFNQCPICYNETRVIYEDKGQNLCPSCFIINKFSEYFDESEHPRDEDGKFAPKGSSASKNITEKRVNYSKLANGSKDEVLKAYKADKQFANMADVTRIFTAGLSSDLNMYANKDINFNEFKRRAISEGVSLNSVTDEYIPLVKEDIDSGIIELKETLKEAKPQKMTLYRGLITKNKFKVNEAYKAEGILAFSTDKEKATSWSRVPTSKSGESVVIEYSGSIKALPTKNFTPYTGVSSEDEFITGDNLKVDNIEKVKLTHKNTGHVYNRYFVKMSPG